jgi:hypothetical protein
MEARGGAARETNPMRRSLVVATLAAFLLVPRASHARVLDPLWGFFSSLWSGAMEKEGCGMDPDGRCAPAVQPKSEEGCGMDPSGRCLPKTQSLSEAGCGADPNG